MARAEVKPKCHLDAPRSLFVGEDPVLQGGRSAPRLPPTALVGAGQAGGAFSREEGTWELHTDLSASFVSVSLHPHRSLAFSSCSVRLSQMEKWTPQGLCDRLGAIHRRSWT